MLLNLLQGVVAIILVITAFITISSKQLIKSVIYLSLLSMISVVAFVFMHAPDVAITEAVIGSGIVTALFIFTLLSARKVGEN